MRSRPSDDDSTGCRHTRRAHLLLGLSPVAQNRDMDEETSSEDRGPTAGGGGGALPAADFPPAGSLHSGYRRAEVDEFVAELRRALSHDPPTMAPYEVADIRFPVTRRDDSYAMEPVDRFLDQAQTVLQELHGADAVAGVEGHASAERSRSLLLVSMAVLALVLLGLLVWLL